MYLPTTSTSANEQKVFSIPTIERVRRRLVDQGIEAALSRQTLKNTKSHKLDGEQEAHLIAIACSQAPVGFARWTLRLLAKRMVELEDEVSGSKLTSPFLKYCKQIPLIGALQ